jgi:hypothetical protein
MTGRLKLAAALLAGAVAFAAAPAVANPAAAAQPGGAVPAGFSSWSEVYAFQNRLNAAAERILAAGGAGVASIVAAPQNRELRVYGPAGAPAAVRSLASELDVPIAFLPARYPYRDLVAEAQRLVTGGYAVEAEANADGSGVAVTVTAESVSADRPALQAVARVPLTITVGDRPQSGGRQFDLPPFSGGSRYFNSTASCSNGFSVQPSGITAQWMLSAGHCGEDGTTVTIRDLPESLAHGTMFNKQPCRDTLLINYGAGTGPRIFVGPAVSFTTMPIQGSQSDFVGNLVVTDGANSGEHLNVPVVAVDVFTTITGIPCASVGPFTRASFTTATCVFAHGDSGGPAYAPFTQSHVLGRGIMSAGRFGTATCGTDTNGSNTVLYAPLFRPAGDPQIGALAANGVAIKSG